jgi:tricorn protease
MIRCAACNASNRQRPVRGSGAFAPARRLCVLGLLVLASAASAQGGRGYYRYPALHGNTIVFAAESDLWSVPATGGEAHRLTTHPGEETAPAISPDGRMLAFTASYEGPAELYLMPLAGGLPERLTFDGDRSTSLGFTPDGKILFTTNHYSTLPDLELVSLDPATKRRTRIPLSQASEASYDSTGKKLFFVRPAFHRNVTKRYRGGTARKIWRFDGGDTEARPLTADYDGESHTPMWWNGRVYFITDRDGTMNLWSMNEDGGDLREHTHHSGWDVRDAYLDAGKIVYQVGADLWLYDTGDGSNKLVPIELVSDFDQLREKWVSDPMDYLTSVHLHPKGDGVVLTSRGRVFVAPAGDGRLARGTSDEGVRYRDAAFMPDGKSLLALSDASGELEFVELPANGVGTPRALTADGKILRFGGLPSPDGKYIAYTDNNNDLWVLEVASRKETLVSTNREGVGDPAWSPDSRFLAYTQTALNTFDQIFIDDVTTGARVAATSDRVNSRGAAWSPDGKFLYFLSDRDLHSAVPAPWGARQPEPYFDAPIKIYELALAAGARSPFRPKDELYVEPDTDKQNDEKKDDKGSKKSKSNENGKDEEEKVTVQLQADGLDARLREVPAGSGNYNAVSVTKDALFWLARDPGRDGKWQLKALPIKNHDPEAVTVLEDVAYYELSGDGKKILARKDKSLYVFDAEPKKLDKPDDAGVDLGKFKFEIDVRDDWRQLFIDAWRLERDYFYDPGMHGVNWAAVRDKYLPLVDRVTTRDELSDLIGRAVGELSALHTSVGGGDLRKGPDDVAVASLGARLTRVERGYRIDHIYRGDPDYPGELSPLADPALGIAEGDVITAINGVATASVTDIGELLRNQAGQQALLGLTGARGQTRSAVVTPTGDEFGLRYADWEQSRRQQVEQKTNDTIGYVHLQAMGPDDITAWYRQFYPVFNRAGLIIDVRHNNGGNIDSFILEKLSRRAWFYWKSRVGEPYWNMQYAPRGHMVVLVDSNTASDGEAFAEGFKRLGLGPVIGTRTWGGEIWLSASNRLSDNGLARAPMMGVYGPERKWLIENHGVDPDIVVDNPPHATFEGQDAQLDAAIEYLRDAIEKDPRTMPEPPPYPDKSFKYAPEPAPSGGR